MLFSYLLTGCIAAASCIRYVNAGLSFKGLRNAPALASNAAIISTPYEHSVSEQEYSQHKVSLVESMVKVQEAIQSIDVMPSCKKLAAKDLLQSCESFEDRRSGQQSSGDEILESYQKLFAIRVTNCEQMDANDVLPDACRPLLQTDLRSNGPRQAISKCLEALNTGNPNQWTTFNRVKLEGTVMCHAMRAEANKDDQIYLLKILLSSLTDVNGAIVLQKDELTAVTGNFRDLSGQMRDFHASLQQDNQEIKAKVKDFSIELKGSMEHVNEGAQELLQAVKEANTVLLDYASQVGSSIQLANSRSDETDAQWVAKLQTYFDALGSAQEQQTYATQQALETFHNRVFDITQSVEIANIQTSVLASKIEEVSLGLDVPIGQIESLKSGAQELAEIQRLLQKATVETLETMEETRELAGTLFNIGEMFWAWLRSTLGRWCMFCAYCIVIFVAALSAMWNIFPRLLALTISIVFAAIFSATFAWIQSPATFVWSILAHHPKFFSPVIWSVLTSVATGACLGEVMRQLYRRLYQAMQPNYELRLPANDYEGTNEKC